MRFAPFAVVVVGGCAGWLGLEPTAPLVDRDSDGVYDEIDNCPEVENVDQQDTDDNGTGDACEPFCRNGQDIDQDGIDDGCDACLRGPDDEDEDGDGTCDAMDLCPAILSGAEDVDNDQVGDVCDRVAGHERRRYFDGFVRPRAVWSSRTPWDIVDGDRFSVDVRTDLVLAAVRVHHAERWSIAIELTLPESPRSQALSPPPFGIDVVDQDRLIDMQCAFTPASSLDPGWRLDVRSALQGSATTVPPAVGAVVFPDHARVRLVFESDGSVVHCSGATVDGTLSDGLDGEVKEADYAIHLRGAARAAFHYVDIIAP